MRIHFAFLVISSIEGSWTVTAVAWELHNGFYLYHSTSIILSFHHSFWVAFSSCWILYLPLFLEAVFVGNQISTNSTNAMSGPIANMILAGIGRLLSPMFA
jgi:hypothetical protein